MQIGIDDVHRSEIIGSLVCAGILAKNSNAKKMKKLGVKDSKILSKEKRFLILMDILPIVEKYEYIKISPIQISGTHQLYNLNDLECEAYCKIAEKLLEVSPRAKVFVNNFDRTREKFIWRAEKLGFHFKWKNWTLAHNNETRHTVVGAASILAKHISTTELTEFKRKYGDFGSGASMHYKTRNFIKSNPDLWIIRKNWITYERLMNEK